MCRQFSSELYGLEIGGFDGDLFGVAIGDHFRPAGERLAEFFDPPRGDDFHRRIKGLGGELEAALVVSLAGRPVGIRVGPDFAGDLQAGLGN